MAQTGCNSWQEQFVVLIPINGVPDELQHPTDCLRQDIPVSRDGIAIDFCGQLRRSRPHGRASRSIRLGRFDRMAIGLKHSKNCLNLLDVIASR